MSIRTLLDHHQRQVNRQAWSHLGDFLGALRANGRLKSVTEPVSPALEITAFSRHSLLQGGPALQFDRVQGNEMPVVGNLFGHETRVLQALELERREDLRAFGGQLAFLNNPKLPDSVGKAFDSLPRFARLAHAAPVVKDAAPWQANAAEGPDVDLESLPITTCWPDDAGPLITWGLVITRGPTKARVNLAIYRLQLIGRNRLIMRWLAHRGGAQDFREFQQNHPGKPFPVTVVIGADPATLLAAVTPIPDTLSEYAFAGLLRGRRSRVVTSTLTGLPVPHGAEIVLEGQVLPGETALEGPFADHTGYYNAQAEFPVFEVQRVSMRDNAHYLTTYMGKPGEDEPSVMAGALNEMFIPLLQEQFPEIVDFYLPPEACSYRVAVVSIRKQYPGHARRIMFGIWSWLRQFTYTKTVIVVDDDIDARDWKDVMWAISTRADPVRDTLLVDNTPIDYLDFASPDPGLGGKMGIDATHKLPPETNRKWGRPATPDPRVQERIEAIAQKLGLFGEA
ncbi:MAG: UbiD family decarboxylase [Xanthomonadales bacterium]|nr:UbiD family decarboxylase [Gammaproteobacteria bacterium]MBT8056609.1 UbiD family decarboxylase [Gammaproteobacteria bacterium]NNL05183.1 UbiD family decarboxylase [Xanthomonadales bacterium]